MMGCAPPETFVRYPHQELTEQIIAAFYLVRDTMPANLLERVYHRALIVELCHAGLQVAQEVPFVVKHRGVAVGHYRADVIVNGVVVVEAKQVSRLQQIHRDQLLHYLVVARCPVGLLLNFGPGGEVRRVENYSAEKPQLLTGTTA
jgi:GxxExxY protein